MRKKHVIVVGLGFGDEGKGRSVAHLTARLGARHVVRFNGGPQAAHHVVTDDQKLHCFAQFGAGSLASLGSDTAVETHLSRHVFVEPFAMEREAEALVDLGVEAPLARISMAEGCRIVTPFHKLINRMQESARGDGRHGSCGMGVGQAFMDTLRPGYPVITVGDCFAPGELASKLKMLWMLKRDLAEQIASAHPENDAVAESYRTIREPHWVPWLVGAYGKFVRESGVQVLSDQAMASCWQAAPAIWEGAQGVLLDAERGFWPHVTPSTTTPANALSLLTEAGVDTERDVSVLGVLRAHHSRHGAGPFVTESPWLTAQLPELHNGKNDWQGGFRQGWFDLLMARYALGVAGRIDGLVITQLDRLCGFGEIKLCDGYVFDGPIDSALDRYFTIDERRSDPTIAIAGIKIPAQAQREHQDGLAQMLRWCKPRYRRLQGWSRAQLDDWRAGRRGGPIDTFLSTLEGELGVPVAYASFGAQSAEMISLASHAPFFSCGNRLLESVAYSSF